MSVNGVPNTTFDVEYVLPSQVKSVLINLKFFAGNPNPLNPDVPELPFIPDVPLLPFIPDVPDVPLEPSLPLLPLVPELPDIPLVPELPLLPEVPELPLLPDVPLDPDDPAALNTDQNAGSIGGNLFEFDCIATYDCPP